MRHSTHTSSALALALTLALLAGHVCAQQSLTTATASDLTGSSATSSSSSAPAAARTWVVTVGKADHAFRPDTLQASVGDVVEFQFAPANHSVVRAEYQYPCIPYELTGRGKSGFFSGFHPVDAILDAPPKWTLRINDTLPVFYYCSAAGSCIDYQMVGVINPNASTSLALQKRLAGESRYMLQPGDAFPTEGGLVMGTGGTNRSSSSGGSNGNSLGSSSTLGAGAIAGIAVGGAALLFLVAVFIWLVRRKRAAERTRQRLQRQRQLQQERQRDAAAAGPMAQVAQLDPSSPIAAPAADPFNGGGTVYIPIRASDFAEYNRNSGSDAPDFASNVSPAGSDRPLVSQQPARQMTPTRLEERQVWPPARPESPTTRYELPAQSRFDGL